MDEKAKQELAERAVQCEAEVLERAARAGYENLGERIATAKDLLAQMNVTIALLMAGIGGALAYGVRVFEPAPGAVAIGAAAVCVYLAVLVAAVVARGLNTREAPMLYNSPKNLLMPGQTWMQVQAGELANLQERIEQQAALNRERALTLDVARYCAVASPLVFAGAVACRYLFF